MIKHYKIKRLKAPKLPRPGVIRQPAQPGEVLYGYINNLKASDIEERWSRAANASGDGYEFRTQYIPTDPPVKITSSSGRNQLGALEVDFMHQFTGLLTAVQIDGAFAHKTADQIESDRLKDAQLGDILYRSGGGVIVRVPGYLLATQDQANQIYREVRSGRTNFGSQS